MHSDPTDYPRGAELYTSDLEGHHIKRLTDNSVDDAEVSVASNGQWILFGSQRSGKMELWRARPDGRNPVQVTHLDGWEPGGAFIFPDNKTIIFRAWRTADAAAHKQPLPMTLYTIHADGTGLAALTHDESFNWSPYPAPDGHHYVFVKVLRPHVYQLFLGDLHGDEPIRLTYSDVFDGYPSISPDGHWLSFTSTRGSLAGSHVTHVFLQDIRV